jgi:hypothetical protein
MLSQNLYSQLAWYRNFGGTGDDKAYAITVDQGRLIYVAGYTTNTNGNTSFSTCRYHYNGNQDWTQSFNGPGTGENKAYAITLDKYGNVIVTGFSTGVNTHHDITTIKYNNNGIQQWVALYNSPFNMDDEGLAVTCDDTANIYVTGFITTSFGSAIYTIKYNPAGTFEWGQLYNGNGGGMDKAYAITVDKYNGVYIGGYTYDLIQGANYTTIKYDHAGNLKWAKTYNGPGNGEDKIYAITVDKYNAIVVTGWSRGLNSGLDYTTIKYDSTGTQQWLARYNGSGNSDDKAYAITFDTANFYYVTGSSRSDTGAGSEDYTTIKYSSSGTQTWVSRYHGAGANIAYNVYVPSDNSAAFVTGTSFTNAVQSYDIALVKYRLTDGVQLDAYRFNGTGNLDDAGYKIASDVNGDVIVGGYASFTGRSYDMVLLKFTNGILLSLNSVSTALPQSYNLYQNYPNPFNPSTKVKFDIPERSFVKLVIYDVLGRELSVPLSKFFSPGQYEAELDLSGFNSGIYFYQLSAGFYKETKKMILIK